MPVLHQQEFTEFILETYRSVCTDQSGSKVTRQLHGFLAFAYLGLQHLHKSHQVSRELQAWLLRSLPPVEEYQRGNLNVGEGRQRKRV